MVDSFLEKCVVWISKDFSVDNIQVFLKEMQWLSIVQYSNITEPKHCEIFITRETGETDREEPAK